MTAINNTPLASPVQPIHENYDLKAEIFLLRDDFYLLHEAYDSLQLLTSDTDIDASRLSGVMKILNHRYDSLMRRFDGLSY